MKRILSILLLSIYLFSTTELIQLLKFPLLIEHYYTHKAKNKQLTILDFLNIHYQGNHLENHPHNKDFEQDQKLPFIRHIDVLSFNIVINPVLTYALKVKPIINQQSKVLTLDDTKIDSKYQGFIWQPPKYC